MDADLLDSLRADSIVCATGATWNRTGFTPVRPERKCIAGLDRPEVLDLAASVAAPGALSGEVLIIDDTGEYAPLGLAERAAGADARVTIVTPRPTIGEEAPAAPETPQVLPVLARLDLHILTGFVLDGIAEGGVEIVVRWSGHRRLLPKPDRVVIAMGRTADRSLGDELRTRGVAVKTIGDALAPRTFAEAVYDGERTARVL